MHHTPPRKDHDSRWLFGKTLTINILQVKDVTTTRYGCVYSIKSHDGVMSMKYEVTIGVFPNCTCPDFLFMLTNFKKRGKCVPCKHLYFIYKNRMFVITRQMISSTNLH
jgi:hypothetical protein